jgi:hypothetical protein
MSNMKFGTYTLLANPSDPLPILNKPKYCAYVLTWSSVGYFNWGVTHNGQVIDMPWSYISSVEFATLDTLRLNDDTVLFDLQDGSNRTFNIKILKLDGIYHHTFASDSGFRKEVKIKILILSQVT